ncbi:MAG: DUF1345 domain-containing protein [Thermomicrobiales bacterium]
MHPDQYGNRAPGRDPVRHFLSALVLAVLVIVVLPDSLGWAIQLGAAWVSALLLLLALTWRVILHSDAATTRRWASEEDPGSYGLLGFVLVISFASLCVSGFFLLHPEAYAPPGLATLLEALGVIAVPAAWALMHTTFAFHYAHCYYRDTGAVGGLDFPGDEDPADFDFAYFAMTIGMTFQTADVAITRRAVRRIALLHALLSFLFNTAILALAVNLIFGRLR